MAEMVLFHHAQGLTPGVLRFAQALRDAGNVVHTPDLYDGRTFDTLAEGMAHLEQLGTDRILQAGTDAVSRLPADLVYGGFSLGVMPAQKLAQTRPGARGAVFVSSCVPADFFGPWPTDLPVQIHAMEADSVFVDDGDLDAARALIGIAPRGELFLYPGDQHLFADDSLPSHRPDTAAVLMQHVEEFLAHV